MALSHHWKVTTSLTEGIGSANNTARSLCCCCWSKNFWTWYPLRVFQGPFHVKTVRVENAEAQNARAESFAYIMTASPDFGGTIFQSTPDQLQCPRLRVKIRLFKLILFQYCHHTIFLIHVLRLRLYPKLHCVSRYHRVNQPHLMSCQQTDTTAPRSGSVHPSCCYIPLLASWRSRQTYASWCLAGCNKDLPMIAKSR